MIYNEIDGAGQDSQGGYGGGNDPDWAAKFAGPFRRPNDWDLNNDGMHDSLSYADMLMYFSNGLLSVVGKKPKIVLARLGYDWFGYQPNCNGYLDDWLYILDPNDPGDGPGS